MLHHLRSHFRYVVLQLLTFLLTLLFTMSCAKVEEKKQDSPPTAETTDHDSGTEAPAPAQPSCTGPDLINSPFAAGSGTAGDPNVICTAAQLDQVRNFSSENFILSTDLNLTNVSFAPIKSFSGSFDGKGHMISNWSLPATNSHENVGFFDNITAGASVKNLDLSGLHSAGYRNSGGLAGSNSGLIDNCKTSGNLVAYTEEGGGAVAPGFGLGGLVGTNQGTVTRSSSSVNISAHESYAGTSLSMVGGLVGNNQGTVDRCFATGNISGAFGYYAGGLVGQNDKDISHSFATGNVTGANFLGGLVGLATCEYGEGPCTISNSYTTSATNTGFGGVIKWKNSATIQNVYSLKAPLSSSGFFQSYGGAAWVLTGIYWNTTLGGNSSPVGVGLTDSDMKKQESFVDYDFNTIWQMPAVSGYPILR